MDDFPEDGRGAGGCRLRFGHFGGHERPAEREPLDADYQCQECGSLLDREPHSPACRWGKGR